MKDHSMIARSVRRTMAFIVSLGLTASAHAGIVFSDGFEAQTLDPFWTTTEISGSVVFPATGQVHGGSQSVQTSSINTASNKYIYLTHDFGSAIYGRVSVWVYDSGADLFSANYLELLLEDTVGGRSVGVLTQDYDLGPGSGKEYLVGVTSIGQINTGLDRTQSWHNWVVDTTPTQLSVSIDGQSVLSTPFNFSFDRVGLYMFAPNWRPAITAYWDDFSLTEADLNAVPEPGSMLLLGSGLVAFFGASVRRGRSGATSAG